jgi:DHA1 family tetracycline resistance protein-like MFS transporter
VTSQKPALGFIFVTLFLDILGIGLIVPVLPDLVKSFRGNNVADAASMVGWLTSVFALMQFVCAPILGSLSDQFGRRPVILISLLGTGLDYILLAVAPNLGWFFVGRLVNGATSANITAAGAYIADISPPEKRAANFGIIGAAFGLGFIAGPLIGSQLGAYSLRLPFEAAAGLALLNWIYGFFVLPESLAPSNRRKFSWRRANPVGSFGALRRFPVIVGLAQSFFLINLAQSSLQSIWVLYTGYRYHWSERQVGLSLAVIGLMAAIVQGGLARRIIPALGERRAIVFGLLVSVFNMTGYALASSGWMIYCILIVGSVGWIATPSLQGLISKAAPPDEQGAVQGAMMSLNSVAAVVAPIVGTMVFAYSIQEGTSHHFPGAVFLVNAVLMLVAMSLTVRTLRKHPVAEVG